MTIQVTLVDTYINSYCRFINRHKRLIIPIFGWIFSSHLRDITPIAYTYIIHVPYNVTNKRMHDNYAVCKYRKNVKCETWTCDVNAKFSNEQSCDVRRTKFSIGTRDKAIKRFRDIFALTEKKWNIHILHADLWLSDIILQHWQLSEI